MSTLGISASRVIKVTKGETDEERNDLLVREEPLEIRIGYGSSTKREEFSLAVTMRTPGADEELARGFLLSEGIVSNPTQILSARYCLQAEQPENTIKVELDNDLPFYPEKFRRNFYASSSCGVCGKAALDAITNQLPQTKFKGGLISRNVLFGLTNSIGEHQNTFKHTGGLHAAALFDTGGELLTLREDIGRHNALDKLIGVSAMNHTQMTDKILWLSGRLGFEMIQKAAMAGIGVVVALGAPSTLAVNLANEAQMTLIGFLKNESFNIYSGKEKVDLSA